MASAQLEVLRKARLLAEAERAEADDAQVLPFFLPHPCNLASFRSHPRDDRQRRSVSVLKRKRLGCLQSSR